LKDLAVLVQTQWAWERDKAEKRFQMVVLNGHEFLLQVVKVAAADFFRVQVIDQAAKEKPALLDSEIELPAGKVSVFGFEDSLSQPYFLAVQRHLDAAVIQESALQVVPAPGPKRIPKILKKVDPVYPVKMLAAGIPGSVTIQVEVNEQGKVWRVKAFRSEDDEFVKAAVAAVNQWQIEPLVVAGRAQSQAFTCTFNFVGGGVALDLSGQVPLNPREEALLKRIRRLSEPRLGKDFKAEKITLRFQEESVAIAAQLLTRFCGIPVLAAPDLQQEKLNCDLRDLPWDKLMARLLNEHGLDVASDGRNGLLIVRPFHAIWPTRGYITGIYKKPPDGAVAALINGKMYYATSGFGKRLNPITKKEDFHPAIDIAAKKGTPVVSSAAGTVTTSEFNDKDGNRIVIDHGNGYTSAYHHLDSRQVKIGDTVTQGQQIGTVGSTGVSMGPHLHFEIRVNGEPQNPFDFIG
jgi:TonB family protein